MATTKTQPTPPPEYYQPTGINVGNQKHSEVHNAHNAELDRQNKINDAIAKNQHNANKPVTNPVPGNTPSGQIPGTTPKFPGRVP